MILERRFVFALGAALAAPAPAKELTLDRVTALPALAGTAPLRPVWSPDSERIAFLWNDRGMPFRDVWVVEASSGGSRRVTHLEGRPGEADAARGGVSDAVWTPDGKGLIFVFEGNLLRVDSEGGAPE